MDLESESSVLESVEDNEVTREIMPHDDDNEINNNGSCPNEIDKLVSGENSSANNTLVIDTGGKYFESEQPANSPPLDAKSPGGGSPPTTKGYGLKKWRRIRREFAKDVSPSIDTGKILKRGLSGAANPAKAQHIPIEIKQNSEGSVGSANVFRTDGFATHGSTSDSRFAAGAAFAAGTDSENSEDRSSKSSTAASVPKMKYDLPAVLGHPREKNRMKNISGKSSGNSPQKSQQGKGRIEGSKKARGERVKIEKENSHSSMESDSRSSNFVFVQGVTSNGKQSGRSMNYDGENSDEALPSEQQFNQEIQQDDLAAHSSWEAKEEKSENHRSFTDQDAFVESIFSLQSVQEALEKEVQNFREIGNIPTSPTDVSNKGSSIPADFTITDPENYIPNSSNQLGSEKTRQTALTSLEAQVLSLTKNVKLFESKLEEARTMLEAKDSRIAELEATINNSKSPREESGSNPEEKCRETQTELEGLFKQKIEAEVEYLAISKTIQKMKVAASDQLTIIEEQKVLAGEQAQLLNKLGGAESKATMLHKQAVALEGCCGDIIGAEEVLKMQGRMYKVTSCFFVQLILLVMMFWLFVLQFSPRSGVVVPT
ncbi:WPP domain-interacting protein 1 [Quercus suber]|uniref:Wpp domain-interacting protein 1 n=1 Tax=Quercus suber TaxID=58331 RepID=A0AAW0JSR6_QUESU|nr:WPP domain-interacting protein 1-like [Quercus suber]POE68611.1 wpp domain-interacting protein 1 [Quercus suber]